jgi:hypothetical protein
MDDILIKIRERMQPFLEATKSKMPKPGFPGNRFDKMKSFEEFQNEFKSVSADVLKQHGIENLQDPQHLNIKIAVALEKVKLAAIYIES